MSPELETLDQLLGGELWLKTVFSIYPDENSFVRGVLALLSSGDVCLQRSDGSDVPEYQWKQLFRDGSLLNDLEDFRLKITEQGVRRIA